MDELIHMPHERPVRFQAHQRETPKDDILQIIKGFYAIQIVVGGLCFLRILPCFYEIFRNLGT